MTEPNNDQLFADLQASFKKEQVEADIMENLPESEQLAIESAKMLNIGQQIFQETEDANQAAVALAAANTTALLALVKAVQELTRVQIMAGNLTPHKMVNFHEVAKAELDEALHRVKKNG